MKTFCLLLAGCLGVAGCQWSKPKSGQPQQGSEVVPNNFPATTSDNDITNATQSYKKGTGQPLPHSKEAAAAQADPVAVLDPLPVDKSIKADAWDAYQQAKDSEEFWDLFSQIAIPGAAKVSLWRMRLGYSPAGAPAKIGPQKYPVTHQRWDEYGNPISPASAQTPTRAGDEYANPVPVPSGATIGDPQASSGPAIGAPTQQTALQAQPPQEPSGGEVWLNWLRRFGRKRTPLPDVKVNLPFWGAGLDSLVSAENLSDATVGVVVDAFASAQDGEDLRGRLDKLPLSYQVKTAFWNLRAGSVCQAMMLAPVGFVPVEANRGAYLEAVSNCWNESRGKPAWQVEAAERLFTLNAIKVADLQKQLDAAHANLAAETNLAANEGKRADNERAVRIDQVGRAGKLASDIYSDFSQRNQQTASALKAQIGALRTQLFALSEQYSNLQSRYEALQRQLLVPRPSLPRAFDCEPTGGGSLACIPGP